MNQQRFYIGTSGWSYSGWLGNFYPEKMKSDLILPYYASKLNSVELNNSFYQIPKEKNVKHWKEITPPDFIFSCKANRYITHFQKLQDCAESVGKLLKAFSNLEEKLGPILFQFPPWWKIDMATLTKFVDYLAKSYLYTFEFRHKSWFCNELYELLHKNQMALCFYDHKMYRSPEIVTSKFIYIRMHGPYEEAYKGAYEDSTLKEYTQKFINWDQENKTIYCYFDNDEKANAPKDAQRLNCMLKNKER